ncbi:hypothetical protein [Streptomyces sp. NPDC056361]|uniref:hypothetical protein n=1 Tax=Streptomyces sp. NPDC056361 TaxID=3345795 RepID=UPI0035DB88D4
MGLPLVLCGPVLRRVDAESVTVWLALREPRRVTLTVYADDDTDGAGSGELMSGHRDTVRLAARCHVVAVTARMAQGAALAWGEMYRYDVRFETMPGQAAVPSQTLYSPGAVADTKEAARHRLTYWGIPGAPALPSFTTPPDDLNKLRVLHASCRKPHGGGVDGMATIDQILTSDVTSLERRPQQLFLTGDQIYADDVADALLHVIGETATELGAVAEVLPGVPPGDPRLAPGSRLPLIKGPAGLNSDEGRSHLMTFADFWAMYLLAWSDVLWPETWPDFATACPTAAARLAALRAKQDPTGAEKKELKELAKGEKKFGEQLKELDSFRRTLPDVRRALANIPSFMMMDDHEVTDDWYIMRRWVDRALRSPLGRRVIQNGLAAYAVCQAWGNTPERFDPVREGGQRGAELLTALSTWDRRAGETEGWLQNRLSLPTTQPLGADGVPARHPDAMDWHYTIDWAKHRAIVLDTRTWRAYPPGPDDPAALLSPQGLLRQISDLPANAEEPLTFLISPAPVVGNPFIEEYLQPVLAKLPKKSANIFTSPDEEGHWGRLFADSEAWGTNEDSFERLLARLFTRGSPSAPSLRRRLIVLSGDVHYGFAATLRYAGTRPYLLEQDQQTYGVLVQFTSSSLKNEELKTLAMHHQLTREFERQAVIQAGVLPTTGKVGWRNATGSLMAIGTNGVGVWTVKGSPSVGKENLSTVLLKTPEWRYGLKFLSHREAEPSDAQASLPRPRRPVPGSRTDALAQRSVAARDHSAGYWLWGSGKDVVGVTNIGEIEVDWRPGAPKQAIQHLWWRPKADKPAGPLTRYVADLAYAGFQPDPRHLALLLDRLGGPVPALDAWVYVRPVGAPQPVLLRTREQGLLYEAPPQSAGSPDPWRYAVPYRPEPGLTAEVAYSFGAHPLPPDVLTDASLYQLRTVPSGPPGDDEPVGITLPDRTLALTAPAELSVWPLLWEPPAADHATRGLPQGAQLWTDPGGVGGALTVTEGAPAPAGPAPVRRGLRVEGTAGPGAVEVRLQVRTLAGARVPLAAESDGWVRAVLGTDQGGRRTFRAVLQPAAADPPLGTVRVFVDAPGLPVARTDAFTVQLCGVQLDLRTEPQSEPAPADERIVVDFGTSPLADARALAGEARARRMVIHPLQNRVRPIVDLGNYVLRPQMPLWLGEVQLLGLTAAELTGLLQRRFFRAHGLSGTPPRGDRLRLEFSWRLTLGWDGPDMNARATPAELNPGIHHAYRYDSGNVSCAVELSYGSDGALLAPDGTRLVPGPGGELPGAYRPAPVPGPPPNVDRHLPEVRLGRPRGWGRQSGAPRYPSLVMEFAPRVVEDGRESVRGGDGGLVVGALTVDGKPLDGGAKSVEGGGDPPLLRLPDFRVTGTNPADPQAVAALVAELVDRYVAAYGGATRVRLLSKECWRATVLKIVTAESGPPGTQHFETRASHRLTHAGGGWFYGREQGMPRFGPPHSYGLGQLDNSQRGGATPDEVWNFLENLRGVVETVMGEKATRAYEHLGAARFPDDRRHRAIYQREIVRRYNGGSEFAVVDGVWQISPSLAPTEGGKPNPRLDYPNRVLGTVVEYAKPWPIAFTADYFPPETGTP